MNGRGAARHRCQTSLDDYATKLYSYDEDAPDPNLKRFSIEQDKSYVLPAIRSARKINSDLHLLAFPRSPPGWMKTSGSMLGGTLRKSSYAPYAHYFVEYLQAYEAEG